VRRRSDELLHFPHWNGETVVCDSSLVHLCSLAESSILFCHSLDATFAGIHCMNLYDQSFIRNLILGTFSTLLGIYVSFRVMFSKHEEVFADILNYGIAFLAFEAVSLALATKSSFQCGSRDHRFVYPAVLATIGWFLPLAAILLKPSLKV
jgi:hypothetical protein